MSNFNVISKLNVSSLLDKDKKEWLNNVSLDRFRERGANVDVVEFLDAWKNTHNLMPLRTEISFDGLNYMPSYYSDIIADSLCNSYRIFAKLSSVEYKQDEVVREQMKRLDFSNLRFPKDVYDYLESSWGECDGYCEKKGDKISCSAELRKQIISNRTERGSRLSKYISQNLSRVNKQITEAHANNVINDNLYHRLSTDANASADSLEIYLKYVGFLNNISDKDYTVVITTEVDAFMRLGHNKGDNRSCFKTSGEYCGAPVQLGVMKNSFVAYLKDADQVVGRAWGFIADDMFLLTNVYSAGGGVPGDTDMVKRILLDALSHLVGYDGNAGYYHPVALEDTYGIYWNGDMLANISDKCVEDFTYASIQPVYGELCQECHCRINIEYDDYITDAECRYICQSCMSDYVYLECRGEYYSFNVCVCDYDREWIHSDDAVTLAAGSYEGEFAHEGACFEMYCGGYCLQDDCVPYAEDSVLADELCCTDQEHVWVSPDGECYHIERDSETIYDIKNKEVE